MRCRAGAAKRLCAMFSTGTSDAPRAPVRRSNAILFRGLPPDIKEDEVKGIFSSCGSVVRARIRQKTHALVSASGYVDFASPESVDKALALHDKQFVGRVISVHALYELSDTISVGCIPLGVDDDQVKALFSSCGEVFDVKTHVSLASEEMGLRYGFVRFSSPSSVSKALELHWTRFAGRNLTVKRTRQRAENFTIWDNYKESAQKSVVSVRVSNIPPQVNEDQLKATFEDCGEVIQARVWRQLSTSNSLGIGYVVFASPESIERALEATKEIAGQRIRVVRVPPLRPSALDHPTIYPLRTLAQGAKTVFVGRLSRDVDGTQLGRAFEKFGDVVGARIKTYPHSSQSRGFGFVTFASPDSVDLAVEHDGILMIHGFRVKIDRDGPRQERPKFKNARLIPTGTVASSGHNRGDMQPNSVSWQYDY